MSSTAFGWSVAGRAREGNEDAFLVEEDLGLYIVCDGVAGHAAGEIAARRAAEAVASHVRSNRELLVESEVADCGRFAVQVLVEGAIRKASARLFDQACSDPELAGMATTMTALLLWNGFAVVGHVGDCRLYLAREGVLQLMTADHTLAAELELQGEQRIGRELVSSVLTRTIGSQPRVLTDTLAFPASPGDILLLCSDGVHRYMTSEEIGQHLRRGDAQFIARRLVASAQERGGLDDMTAIVLRIGADPPHGATASPEVAHVRRHMDLLAGVPLLQGMSMKRLAALLGAMQVQEFQEGEAVLAAGAHAPGMHVVTRGRLADTSMRELVAGDIWGEPALTSEYVVPAPMFATENCETLLLSRESFERLSGRHPRLACALLQRLLAAAYDERLRARPSHPTS